MSINKVTRAKFTHTISTTAVGEGKKLLILIHKRAFMDVEARENAEIDVIMERCQQRYRRHIKVIDFARNREMCKCIDRNLPERLFPVLYHNRCIDWQNAIEGSPELCHLYANCELSQSVEQVEKGNFDIVIMTHAKFFSLMRSTSSITVNLFRGIKRHIDVVVFDESRHLTEITLPSRPLSYFQKNITNLRRLISQGTTELASLDRTLQYIVTTANKLLQDSSGLKTIDVTDYVLSFEDVNQAIETLKYSYYAKKDIGELPLTIPFASSPKLHLRRDEIIIDGEAELELRKEAVEKLLKQGKGVILADATNSVDYFQKVFGQHEVFDWGDPDNTEAQQLIVTDTKNVSVDFWLNPKRKDQEETKARLKALLKHFSANEVMVVTFSTRVHTVVKDWIENDKELQGLQSTYYRSGATESVSSSKRLMYCILLPYSPYLPHRIEEIATGGVIDTAKGLKAHENSATFLQAIGRAKCPHGLERSVVLIDGATQKQVDAMIKVHRNEKNGLPKPNVLKPYHRGRFLPDAITLAEWWRNEVDKGITVEDKIGYRLADLPVLVKFSNELKKGRRNPSQIIRDKILRETLINRLKIIEPGIHESVRNRGRPKKTMHEANNII